MNYRICVNKDLCKGVDGCGLCIHICPKNVYEKGGTLTGRGVYSPEAVNIDQCTGCKLCVIYCPDLALVVEPEDVTIGRRHKSRSQKERQKG